ncbi:ATP-binding cassette domain-containing protein [Sphingomonas sp. 1P06PA]|uniref:methionine ABC transporter ATP-binding protein n=1 Tax=Sphingomonas sp. 1P06PA TaxID=554121 RepID=UPI0039A726FF
MIQVESVSRQFPGAARPAVDGVSFEVAKGEIFGIIGRSGAGKSTLIRMLNGLERPDAGQLHVNGTNVGGLDALGLRRLRRGIGMIFQHFGLLSSRTVAQNIAFPLRSAGLPKPDIAARVDELLALVGLGDHAAKYPAQLSGGQKQRVGIARALATGPSILLCDEATSALDPDTTRDVLQLLARLNRDLGLTVVLITHEMDVVREVCDRVAVMQAGRFVESGPVETIFLSPAADETRALLAEAGDTIGDPATQGAGRLIRFTALGAASEEPFLTRAAQESGCDIAIMGGRIGHLRRGPFRQLTLGIAGGDPQAAVAALGRYGTVAAL